MVRRNPGKGSQFEREFCKLLSSWWTNGERDDVFWRSQTSGGRATQRKKIGKKTFGQYGDVAATDPTGLPLLKLMTIELKNGYKNQTILNSLDFTNPESLSQWDKWIEQIETDTEASGSYSWMIVHKRYRHHPLVCVPEKMFSRLKRGLPYPRVPFDFVVYVEQDGERFYLFRLENFWSCISPQWLMGTGKFKKKNKLKRKKG